MVGDIFNDDLVNVTGVRQTGLNIFRLQIQAENCVTPDALCYKIPSSTRARKDQSSVESRKYR